MVRFERMVKLTFGIVAICLLRVHGRLSPTCRPNEASLNPNLLKPSEESSSGLDPRVSGTQLWPNATVPFVIDPGFLNRPEQMRQLVDRLNDIMKRSCIKFQPRVDCSKNDYITMTLRTKFTDNIGRTGFRYDCGLSPFNLAIPSEATHQLFHVLGFEHEEQRTDVSKFISGPVYDCALIRPSQKIFINQLVGGLVDIIAANNTSIYFNSRTSPSYRIPDQLTRGMQLLFCSGNFDFGSVTIRMKKMWCPRRMFNPLVEPVAENRAKMWQSSSPGATDMDFQKLNTAYKCSRQSWGRQESFRKFSEISGNFRKFSEQSFRKFL